MVFEISNTSDDPRRLTQAVTQITTFLGLYHAELARILGVKCADIGQLTSGSRCLEPGTMAWQQARLYLRLYQALFARTGGDGVAMWHWLRVSSPELDGIPQLLIIDKGRLADVVAYLERTGTGNVDMSATRDRV